MLWDGDGSESPRLNTSLCFELGVCARPAMLSPASLQISFHCPVKLFFFLIYLGFFSLSVLTGEKIADCLQLLCSTETRKSEKSKAFTATFLVCITDVAQMMCMFYI